MAYLNNLQMIRFSISILFLLFLFIGDAQSETAHLTCQSESQTWPQSGKILKGNKIMFYHIEFSKNGIVKIYQDQKKEPFRGIYDKKVIKSVSTTKKGFERDLIINRATGSFTDRYFVIHHGKQEIAWIDKGNCNI